MDLDLQGSIGKFTLPEILQLIAAGRKSGTLAIQHDDSIVMIYFDRGDITYGYGPRQTFHLGRMLLERRILAREQLDRAVAVQAKADNGRRLGEILIELGYIDRADLTAMITEQVETLLYSLLAWQDGTFKFYENQFPTDEEITVRLSVENVILEGLRRLDEAQMIDETIPDLTRIYSISAAQAGRERDVRLSAEEWNMLALVDGHRPISEVIQLSRLDATVGKQICAKLKLAGLITLTDREPTAAVSTPSPATTELEQMTKHLASLFEAYLDDKELRPVTSSDDKPGISHEVVERPAVREAIASAALEASENGEPR